MRSTHGQSVTVGGGRWSILVLSSKYEAAGAGRDRDRDRDGDGDGDGDRQTDCQMAVDTSAVLLIVAGGVCGGLFTTPIGWMPSWSLPHSLSRALAR